MAPLGARWLALFVVSSLATGTYANPIGNGALDCTGLNGEAVQSMCPPKHTCTVVQRATSEVKAQCQCMPVKTCTTDPWLCKSSEYCEHDVCKPKTCIQLPSLCDAKKEDCNHEGKCVPKPVKTCTTDPWICKRSEFCSHDKCVPKTCIQKPSLCNKKKEVCTDKGVCAPKALHPVPSRTYNKRSVTFAGRGNACPETHTACVVSGLKHGYECIDTSTNIESCGGCPGVGVDCTALVGAEGVGCVAGACEIYSCSSGYKWDAQKQICASE